MPGPSACGLQATAERRAGRAALDGRARRRRTRQQRPEHHRTGQGAQHDGTIAVEIVVSAMPLPVPVMPRRPVPVAVAGPMAPIIAGALGYRDGKRFFKFGDQDPMLLMLQQEMEALQQRLERKELDARIP